MLTITLQPGGEVQSTLGQLQAPVQPAGISQGESPPSIPQEAPAQTPGPSVDLEPFPSNQEESAQYAEPSVEVEPLGQQVAPIPPAPGPSVGTESLPGHQVTPAQSARPSVEVTSPPTQLEQPTQDAEPSLEAEPSPGQQEQKAVEEVESISSPEIPQEEEPSSEEIRLSPAQQEAPAPVSETEEVKSPPAESHEAAVPPEGQSPTLPSVSVNPVEIMTEAITSSQQEVAAQASGNTELDLTLLKGGDHSTVSTSIVESGDPEVTFTSPSEVEPYPALPSLAEPKAMDETAASPKEIEPIPTEWESPAEPLEALPITLPSPPRLKVSAQHPEMTVGSKTQPQVYYLTPSPTTEGVISSEPLTQPPEPLQESVDEEAIVPKPAQEQAPYLILPRVTFQPLKLQLTITPGPSVEAEHSTALKTTTTLDSEISHPDQVQTHHAALPKVTVAHWDLGNTPTPELNIEVDQAPTTQETPVQLTEPSTEVAAQPPVLQEVAVPTPAPPQPPVTPSVTDQTLNLPPTPTNGPEPTAEAEHETALKEPTGTSPDAILTQHLNPSPAVEVEHSTAPRSAKTPPPGVPEVTLPQAELVQAQHPNLTEVTVQAFDIQLAFQSRIAEVESSPALQKTSAQPPEPPLEVVAPIQHIVPVSVTVEAVKTEIFKIPEPTTLAEQSTALETTSAAPPRHSEVPPTYTDQSQTQQVTGNPLNLSTEVKPTTISVTLTRPPEPTSDIVTVATSTRVTGQPSDSRVTGQPSDSRVTGQPSDSRVTGQPSDSRVTGQPSDSRVTGQPSDSRVTGLLSELEPIKAPVPAPEVGPSKILKTTAPPAGQFPTLYPEVKAAEYATQLTTFIESKESTPNSTDICELCTCKNGMLSCTNLSPWQKLHQVPVPGSFSAHNDTFTIL
ncbi:leucine-rich repeat-containing protein 37A3-like [Ochotona curzoniae]|uniref:leucine-rich repeat-containing protein 37A3-like n=1 Tax=Ochotona curzoniae TaxID=130825 RepID=UPI001B34E09F|nr:leucine-rich repeat-containing protein 37A3-like [Ochotona curzoniae]